MTIKYWLQCSALLLCLTVIACVKDKPNPPQKNPEINENLRLLVANEGVYGNGNASLSYIDLTTKDVFNNVLSSVNNNMVLGDVLQSIMVKDSLIYLVVNNSNKIVIVDQKTFALKGQINVPQPRYILPLDNNKAIVSSMYMSKVFVIDLTTKAIIEEIAIPFENSEGMILVNNKVYICPWDTACNYIYKMNTQTFEIEDSISIGGFAPNAMQLDKDGKLWVFAGNPVKGKNSSITQIDLSTKQILKTISFSNNSEIIKPSINITKDTLYYLGVDYNGNANAYNGVYKMSITATIAPSQAFVPALNMQYFWSLGINPYNGHVFIGDPKGFIQNGAVLEYDPNGNLLNIFNVGLGPSFFYFE